MTSRFRRAASGLRHPDLWAFLVLMGGVYAGLVVALVWPDSREAGIVAGLIGGASVIWFYAREHFVNKARMEAREKALAKLNRDAS